MPLSLKHRETLLALRRTILVILILFLAFLAGSITFNLKSKEQQPASTSPTEPQALTFHEDFRALEFSGQKRRISLKAGNFFIDSTRNQHLEGGVEIIDEELAESLFLQAARAQIDASSRMMTAEGQVELKTGPVQIKASSLVYHLQNKEVRANGVKVIWQNLSLRGEKLAYEANREEGILEGKVEVKSLKSEPGFSLKAKKIRFNKKNNRIEAENLALINGPLVISSQAGLIFFKKESSDYELIQLEGQTEIGWKATANRAGLNELRIKAEELDLKVGDDLVTLSSQNGFALEGSGELWQFRSQGVSLRLIFTSELEAEKIFSRNMNFHFSGKKTDDFSLFGQQAEYDLSSELLELHSQAAGSFRNYELKADQIKFNLTDDSINARNVLLGMKPGFFEQPPLLFKKDSPWFISGDYLEGKPEIFDLEGKVRIWQDEALCLAEEARLEPKTGNLFLERLERASWLYRESDDQTKKIELKAEKAGFKPSEKKVVLAGEAEFSQPGLKLKATEMHLYFRESLERLSGLEGSGQVSLVWKDYRASGLQISLSFEDQKVVMTGYPELWTADGSHLETDKLTLFLADDKIWLESQKRERSLTVLVRQK